MQDIAAGYGVGLLDPHGDLTRDVLARMPEKRLREVILLDLLDSDYPFGLNLFSCPDRKNSEQVALTAASVMHVFEKVWDVGPSTPQLAQFLRNICLTLIANRGTTLAEIPLLLQDETARGKLLSNVTNHQVRLFWQTYNKLRPGEQLERASSTLNKVDAFLTQPLIANIVGQSTTLDFRQIIDQGKILLVQLTPRLEDISSLLGAVIIGQLLNAALSRKDLPERHRRQFNLYADEYQRFATEDFATLLAEARKFGIAITIAHQARSQLDRVNRGASLTAAHKIVFRISGEDSEELSREFDHTPPLPLVIGQRPVLTPVQDVLGHLLNRGSHPNSRVSAFLDATVGHAERRIKQLEQQYSGASSLRDIPGYTQLTAASAQLKLFLNLLFSKAQAGIPATRALTGEAYTLFFAVYVQGMIDWLMQPVLSDTAQLIEFRRTSLYNHVPPGCESERSRWQQDIFGLWQALSTGKNYQAVATAYETDMRKWLQTTIKDTIMQFAEVLKNSKEYSWSTRVPGGDIGLNYTLEQRSRMVALSIRALTPYLKWSRIDAAERKYGSYSYDTHNQYIDKTGRTRYFEDTNYVNQIYIAENSQKWIDWTIVEREMPRILTRIIAREKPIFDKALADLVSVYAILAKEPILEPSGQQEPIYDKPRSFADMGQEIANTLVNLPNFQAKVKTLTGEYLIDTLPHSPGLSDAQLAARIALVREHTRKTVCRPRQEVEAVIKQRQAGLRTQLESRPAQQPARRPAHSVQNPQPPPFVGEDEPPPTWGV